MNKLRRMLIFGDGKGGGGGGNHTIKGLTTYTIKPTDPTGVTDSYKGTSADDKTLANCPSLSTLLDTFYDKYIDANLTNYTVTKKSLGKDQSGTYDIYEYDFKPANWDRMILLSSGMHGYEVASIFGLAYLMDDIVENYEGDTLLTYLHEQVRIKVIPVISPWGYSQSPKSYIQSRAVNINRNFDYQSEWESYTDGDTPNGGNPNNYKGTRPFSEAETQILRQWATDNYGCEFWIDCHTSVGVTNNKEIFTSTISNTPLFNEVNAAHAKLETWTKQYYHLNSVSVEYRVDSAGAGKGRWYTGIYGKTGFVIEQCSDCATIGNTYNGDKNSIVNYSAQIYAYIGEFLLKADETVNYSLAGWQSHIENMKYVEPEPTTLYVHQGTLKSSDGTPTPENMTRVYTDAMPIAHARFAVEGFGNGLWFGGRFYTSNDAFKMVLSETPTNNTVAFKYEAEFSSSWGITDYASIVQGTQVSGVAKMKLIIRTEDGTDNITPSDVAGMVIVVDDVKYKLAIGT